MTRGIRMNVKKFNKLLEERIEKTRQVLNSKNKEYATNADKLRNFKRTGAMLRVTPEKALIGMWSKHIISILDIVDKITIEKVTKEMVEEKIGDAINYLILLEALIKERYQYTEKGTVEIYCGKNHWTNAGITKQDVWNDVNIIYNEDNKDGYTYYWDDNDRLVYRIKREV